MRADAPIIRTIDLFCGCGGLTEGFSIASNNLSGSFECVGAIDNWAAACDAFALNHGVRPICDDVSARSIGSLLDQTGDVDVLIGGPPCQGFSTSGKRALDDPRNSMVKAFFDAVELARPRAFVMENVSGFTNFQRGAVMREAVELAFSLGYRTFAGILLASLHGVPQRRRRFMLVGLRDGSFTFPLQSDRLDEQPPLFSHASDLPVLAVDQRVGSGPESWTFDDATCDLPAIEAGESATAYAGPPVNAFQEWARAGVADDQLTDHIAGQHRDYFIELMSHIPPGRSAMEPEIRERIPKRLRPTSGFPNSYARIRGDEPSPTITRNFTTPSSANCIHPRLNRALTLREGARCQSFPDHYRFAGSFGDRRLMIGNAVPPLLARSVAGRLLKTLGEVRERAACGGGSMAV